jgi:hypothetical protein
MKRGFFIVAELTGPSRDAVLEVQRWADPKLAKDTTPHITLVGKYELQQILKPQQAQ